MKENKQITIENTSLSSPDRWIYLQDQIDKVSKLCTGQKEFVRNRRLKNDGYISKYSTHYNLIFSTNSEAPK